MRLVLICEGSNEAVRLCPGHGIAIISMEKLNKFENLSGFLKEFKDNKLHNQIKILSLLVSIRQVDETFPILEIIDFFSFHRHHSFYLEIQN